MFIFLFQSLGYCLERGELLQIPFHLLRSTQMAYGKYEVELKVNDLKRLSKRKRLSYLMDPKNRPEVILGPNDVWYVPNGQHTAHSSHQVEQDQVFSIVIGIYNSLSQEDFAEVMRSNRFFYPKTPSGVVLDWPDVSRSLTHMIDDPYRSLSWLVRKAGGYKGIKSFFFQEFFWAEYFKERFKELKITWDEQDEKEWSRVLKIAYRLAHNEAASSLRGYKKASEHDCPRLIQKFKKTSGLALGGL